MFSQNGRIITVINRLISIYAVCLLIVGTILNLFSIYICRRRHLKNTSTFIILSFFFFFSACALYTWNLDVFLSLFNIRAFTLDGSLNLTNPESSINVQNVLESLNIFTCKLFTFMQYFSLQCISWLLTFITIDQNLRVYSPKRQLTNKWVYSICAFLVAVFFLINFHIIIFVGVYRPINGTNLVEFRCYETDYYTFYPMWDQVHMFLYCFVPFFIMIIGNLMLARKLILARRHFKGSMSKSGLRKKKNISVFCVGFSFMFIFCTIPEKICYGFMYEQLNHSSGKWYGPTLLRLVDELNFSFIGLNFVFQLALNRIYRREFFKMFHRFSDYFNSISFSHD